MSETAASPLLPERAAGLNDLIRQASPVAHLEECSPEDHSDWQRMTYGEARDLGAYLCKDAEYMALELYVDEPVWVEVRS